MRAVRFHPEADQELTEAREWYAARSEVAAQAYALEIDHAVERILESARELPDRQTR